MKRNTTILFALVNILNYLDRYLLPAVLPSVTAELNLSKADGGILVSAFVIGYVIFSPIFGFLGDRYSRPKLMAVGVFLWSLATLLTAFASGFYPILFARILVGIGEASFVALAPGYFKDRLQDEQKLQSTISIFFSAVPIGAALAYALGAPLSDHFGWQRAFLLLSFPGLICTYYIARQPESRAEAVQDVNVKVGIRAILNSKLFLLAVFGYVLNSFALSGVAAFITEYGVLRGFTLSSIGFFFGVVLLVAGGGGTLLGGLIARLLSERSDNKLKFLFKYVALSAFLASPLLFFTFWVDSPEIFLVLAAVTELMVFLGTGPLNTIIVMTSPLGFLALAQGVSILLINVFGALPSPYIIGKFADSNAMGLGLSLLSIPLLASALFWAQGSKSADKMDSSPTLT